MAPRHSTAGGDRSAQSPRRVRASAGRARYQLLADIDATIQSLIRDPRLHPVYYRGFRRVLERRFPYKLFYRLESNRIIVFRILHVRRDHPRLLRPGQ